MKHGTTVVHWGRAREFYQKHPDAEIPLKAWKMAVQASHWNNFTDVKRTFNTADWVDGKIVFDIKGNNYRLIAIAQFENHRLYIRHVMTHREYDEGRWRNK